MNSKSELSWEEANKLAEEANKRAEEAEKLAEEAEKLANKIVLKHTGKHLSDLEAKVLKGAIKGKTYDEIGKETGYAASYLNKDIGGPLWKKLSEALGEDVSKTNLWQPLKRYQEALPKPRQDEEETPLSTPNLDGEDPLVEPEVPSGQGSLDIPYVERVPYEAQCYEEIVQPGALIRIKAPQQMGKTWLMEKLREKVAAKGFRTVTLSFKLADISSHLTKPDKFLRWFCTNVSRQLKLTVRLDDYWEQDLGSKVSCKAYFEEYLLKQIDTPLVLFLDDVDSIFKYNEISAEFFALPRIWYDQARSRGDISTRLRVVLIHSTQDYIRLNINESPFNVGVPFELSDFSQQQVQDLTKQYGLDWDAAQVKQLMEMVGGYPYLVQQALSHLKNHQDITLDELLETASKESGIYGNYLRPLLLEIQKHLELASALKKVVTATESVQLKPLQAYKLHSMGLVEWKGNEVEPRCNLFRQYFCNRLGIADDS